MNLKDEIWRSLRKEEERRLSMITRTDLDDHTGMDVLNFVAGQEITSIAKNRNLYNEIEEATSCKVTFMTEEEISEEL